MPDRHREFVRQENIRHFQQQLAAERDPERRRLLLELLAREQADREQPISAEGRVSPQRRTPPANLKTT